MASYPQVTMLSLGIDRLSNKDGANTLTVTFSFDKEVLEYRVSVSGTDMYNGTLAGTDFGAIDVAGMYGIPANTILSVILTSTEMYTEGDNRINVYGKGMDGTWTPYDSQ